MRRLVCRWSTLRAENRHRLTVDPFAQGKGKPEPVWTVWVAFGNWYFLDSKLWWILAHNESNEDVRRCIPCALEELLRLSNAVHGTDICPLNFAVFQKVVAHPSEFTLPSRPLVTHVSGDCPRQPRIGTNQRLQPLLKPRLALKQKSYVKAQLTSRDLEEVFVRVPESP